MKKLKINVCVLLIGFSFAFAACAGMISIRGNGDLVTSERNISPFEKIEAHGEVDVRYYASEEYRAVVTADLNLDEYTKVYTDENVLIIGTENGNYDFSKYLVEVYCPTLNGVSISGSGRFSSNDEISTSTFDARVSGSGKISLSGNSTHAAIDISGSGKFEGSELYAKNASVKIRGSGKATIFVEENLKAKISGSGNLYYSGNPKTDFDVSGSGEIDKM